VHKGFGGGGAVLFCLRACKKKKKSISDEEIRGYPSGFMELEAEKKSASGGKK
jgi:hypothetical protein